MQEALKGFSRKAVPVDAKAKSNKDFELEAVYISKKEAVRVLQSEKINNAMAECF